MLTLSVLEHQPADLLDPDCLGILRSSFCCVMERMRCMPSDERAGFIELSISDLLLKWRHGSGHEHGPRPTVADISLSWKTLYK